MTSPDSMPASSAGPSGATVEDDHPAKRVEAKHLVVVIRHLADLHADDSAGHLAAAQLAEQGSSTC